MKKQLFFTYALTSVMMLCLQATPQRANRFQNTLGITSAMLVVMQSKSSAGMSSNKQNHSYVKHCNKQQYYSKHKSQNNKRVYFCKDRAHQQRNKNSNR